MSVVRLLFQVSGPLHWVSGSLRRRVFGSLLQLTKASSLSSDYLGVQLLVPVLRLPELVVQLFELGLQLLELGLQLLELGLRLLELGLQLLELGLQLLEFGFWLLNNDMDSENDFESNNILRIFIYILYDLVC